MKKLKVLFLCTGNSARSQIAEAFLRHHGGIEFEVYSAGLKPKGINPYTIQVMDEVGIDIRGQSSDNLRKYMGFVHFHYAITVCSHMDQHCPRALWAQGHKLHWDFEDPAMMMGSNEEKLAKFRQIRDQIEAQIKQWLQELNIVRVAPIN